MKPILYHPEEMAFENNGIGVLSDAISCKVAAALNGQYEITMQYPVGGIHFDQICMRSVILAKVDPVSALQPFRVYRITKPSNGIVTVYARHVAYDLSGHVVTPFTADGVVAAMSGLSSNAVTDCPFTFTTDKSTAAVFTVAKPADIWKLLGGTSGSLLDVYGGEYEFDRWIIKLWNRRGMDRGVSIRYGKNLTSLEQDQNCANCYTGVMPFWVDRSTGAVTKLPGNIVAAEGNFGYTKILPLDLSAEFDTAPTEAELEAAAKSYMKANKIGEPIVSWKVEFVQLEQTEEYKGKALLERVLLGDTVSVEFPQMCVSACARAVSAVYDCLLERYDSITLGSVRANISDTIAEQNKEIANRPNKTEMQIAVEQLTNTILGATGGSVRLLDNNGDKIPDTLYIADNPDPALAVKVWRFNYEGWGASENGYNGPFVMGATLEDGFLADFIKAGTLDAALVKVINLIAEKLISEKGDDYVSVDGARIQFINKMLQGDLTHCTAIDVWNDGFSGNSILPVMYLQDWEMNETTGFMRRSDLTEITGHHLKVGGDSLYPKFEVQTLRGYSEMKVDAVNPGKVSLFTGSAAINDTFTVSNTDRYDLFAVKVSTSSGTKEATILAYKYGNIVSGNGSWGGSSDDYKDICFVSARVSGDRWTLLSATCNDITPSGALLERAYCNVVEVIGVI